MNGYPNLSNILKKYIGKKFYNPMFGYVTLIIADDDNLIFLTKLPAIALYLEANGTVSDTGKMGIFPRASSEDWNEWVEQHKNDFN